MKDKLILKLNTAVRDQTTVELYSPSGKINDNIVRHVKAQECLSMINELLARHNVKLPDLTGIEVNPGPGSFVGVRVGVAIANTLGFFLHIPVNGKKPPVLPKYG